MSDAARLTYAILSITVNSSLRYRAVSTMTTSILTPLRPRELALHTKQKWQIPNEMPKERAPESLRAARELWEERFPNIDFRTISSTYNCVGMVIASRRTDVHPEHLERALVDDGFRKINETEAKAGDNGLLDGEEVAMKEIFEEIESHRFAAEVSVASTIPAFIRAAGSQASVKRLLTLANLSGVAEIAQRTTELVSAEYDPEFFNPADVAVAIYLWVIGTSNEALARTLARQIVGDDWWWARKIAESLASPQTTANTAVLAGRATVPDSPVSR